MIISVSGISSVTDKVTLASVDTPAVPFLVTLKVLDSGDVSHCFVKFSSL